MSLRTLQLAVCILAFALVIVNFAPRGTSVCIQNNGDVFTGVGCQCDSSQNSKMNTSCLDGCCTSKEDEPQVESRCCICLQLLFANVIPSVNQTLVQQAPVDSATEARIVFFPKSNYSCSVMRQTDLHPPPLKRTTVLRI